MRPVARGIIPRKAQGELGPTNAREIIPSPARTLKTLSVEPIFFFTIFTSRSEFLLIVSITTPGAAVCDKVTKE
jgi:hypothetical protein